MSTKWPSMAAAAAIAGETRCVRPPRPWRPSKLRFEVEAQRSPGREDVGVHAQAHGAARRAPVEAGRAEHAVQPLGLGLRAHLLGARDDHRPDAGATGGPRTTWAAARRSPMREFVQEPMKTRSSRTSCMGVPGSSAM